MLKYVGRKTISGVRIPHRDMTIEEALQWVDNIDVLLESGVWILEEEHFDETAPREDADNIEALEGVEG